MTLTMMECSLEMKDEQLGNTGPTLGSSPNISNMMLGV